MLILELFSDEKTDINETKMAWGRRGNQVVRKYRCTIGRLKGKITMIVVAHRLTTLKYCDRIYKLQDGKIVNMGSYSEIIGDENGQV